MELNETNAPTYYNSRYHHNLDDKRRLQIPAKWRPAEPGTEFTIVVWPKTQEGPCLKVLPPKQMAALVREIDEMPNSDTAKGVLKRIIGGESIQVALDKAGRVVLPEPLAEAAGLKAEGEAVLVGCLDRFEIWSRERYEKVRASDAVMTAEAFKRME
jgi:MraZ protein